MGDRTCAVQGLPVFRDETDGWDNHIRPGDKVLEVGQPVGNPGVEVVLVRKHKGINPSDEELALFPYDNSSANNYQYSTLKIMYYKARYHH